MDQNDIDRINTLYNKSKSVGLTPEEKEEQARLRQEYIAAIRRNMRGSLNNISIVEKDGAAVRSAADISRGDRVNVKLSGGSLDCRVEEVHHG